MTIRGTLRTIGGRLSPNGLRQDLEHWLFGRCGWCLQPLEGRDVVDYLVDRNVPVPGTLQSRLAAYYVGRRTAD